MKTYKISEEKQKFSANRSYKENPNGNFRTEKGNNQNRKLIAQAQ